MTGIKFDFIKHEEDLKEINEITHLIESKKDLLEKYNIKFSATSLK